MSFFCRRRGACSSICVNLYRGAARHIQLHMCQFLSGRDAAGIAPYVSNYTGEQRGAYVSISIRKRRDAYSSICVNLFVGGRRDAYVSIFSLRGDASHMCQFLIRERRGEYVTPYVSIYSSGRGETHAAPYVSISHQGATRRICVIFFIEERRICVNFFVRARRVCVKK